MSELGGDAALDAAIADAGGFTDTAEVPDASLGTTAGASVGGPAPDAVEDDDFDAVPDHEELSNGVKRVNRIPKPRVEKMLQRKMREAEAAWLGGFREPLGLAADAPLTADDIRKHLTERGTKAAEAERELQAMQYVKGLMETQPEQFLAMLAQQNPAYQRYVQPPQAPKAPETLNLDEYSVDLGDGRRTFTFDGLKKYIDQIEDRVTSRFAPIEEQAKAETQYRENLARLHRQADQARREWPGFKEHEKDIAQALAADPRLSMHDAYIKVAVPKLQAPPASEAEMRERLMKELQAAPPVSTATTTTPTPATAPSLDDLIAANIAKASAAA